jgi:hypothetical protein
MAIGFALLVEFSVWVEEIAFEAAKGEKEPSFRI